MECDMLGALIAGVLLGYVVIPAIKEEFFTDKATRLESEKGDG